MGLIASGIKKDYALERTELGKGKFGMVRLATHRKTGREAAVKVNPYPKRWTQDRQQQAQIRKPKFSEQYSRPQVVNTCKPYTLDNNPPSPNS